MAVHRRSIVRSAALQKRLEFGEGVLDRVEIGAVGRKVQQRRACGYYGGADAWALMAAQIIHGDDAARGKRGDQNLIDIGLEPDAVEGAVDDHGRGRRSWL